MYSSTWRTATTATTTSARLLMVVLLRTTTGPSPHGPTSRNGPHHQMQKQKLNSSSVIHSAAGTTIMRTVEMGAKDAHPTDNVRSSSGIVNECALKWENKLRFLCDNFFLTTFSAARHHNSDGGVVRKRYDIIAVAFCRRLAMRNCVSIAA